MEPVVQLEIGNSFVTACLLVVPANTDVELQVASNSPVILNIEAFNVSLSFRIQRKVANTGRQTNEERIVKSFTSCDRIRDRVRSEASRAKCSRQTVEHCRCGCIRADNGSNARDRACGAYSKVVRDAETVQRIVSSTASEAHTERIRKCLRRTCRRLEDVVGIAIELETILD